MQEYDNQSVLSTKLMTTNNTHVIPNVAFNTLKKMEEVTEKQFVDFLNHQLIYQKRSACENDFCIWYSTEIDTEKSFTPSNVGVR